MDDKNQSQINFSVRKFIQFILLSFSLILYFLLDLTVNTVSQVNYYFLIITPVYFIYFYFLHITLNQKWGKLLAWVWFLGFGLVARLLFINDVPLYENVFYNFVCKIHSSITTTEIIILKLSLLLVEILFVVILIKIMDYFKISRYRLTIFLLNPLVIIETYYYANIEIVGLLFFWAAIYLFYRKLDRSSFILFLGSSGTNIIYLFSMVAFVFRKYKSRIIILFVAVLLIMLILNSRYILLVSGFISRPEWLSVNGVLYQMIYLFGKTVNLDLSNSGAMTSINGAGIYYILLVFILSLIIVFDQLRKVQTTSAFRSVNYLQVSFIISCSFILCIPVLQTHFLIIIIPFLIFFPAWSWIWFTFLIQFIYFDIPEDGSGLLLLFYVPFIVLLIFEVLDKRKIKGWFLK